MRQSDQKEFAAKVVKTSELEMLLQLKNEFVNLRKLDHPNVIKVYELYFDMKQHRAYLVMEYVEDHRELFEAIQEMGKFSGGNHQILC
jgi:calcium-dependent protein kinase